MIILERFCVLALHLSLVLQITTRSALAASPRPNAARLDALEDFLLAIPDRLSYELNPGLFKRAPQATETGGGGGATGGGGGATGGGGDTPTGGGGGPTQPDPTTAPPVTTGPTGGSTPPPDTTGPGQGGNETTDPPSSPPSSDPPNTSTTQPPNVDSSSSSNTSSPSSTPTDTSPTVSASGTPSPATGSDGSATATGTGSDTTGDSSISTGGSTGLPPTATGGSTDTTGTGTQTGSASDDGTSGGGTTPSGTGTGTAHDTETSTSVPVSTSVGVSTGEDGPHLITYGSWVDGTYYSYNPATETSTSSAPAQTPWVEQNVPPSAPPPPGCSVDYYPADGWETTGSEAGAAASSSAGGGNPGGQGAGLCNNGTKVAKKPGAKIELTFIGVEAQLQFVPSQLGGQYSIQLDDEEPLTFDSYKPDLTQCEYTVPWHRTNLDNKPHNVTIIVKGASDQVPSSGVGTISASQVEFGGLVYKGPPTKKKKSNTPIIIGAAAGAAVLLIAIALITYYIVRRRRRQRQADNDPAPFPGPAMSTISSPRPGYTPALPSSLAATPTPTFGETASIAPSQRPPSKVQSAFEQQYAQMHGHSHSHSRSMSDASMQVPQDPKMSWYGYEPPPPPGQPVQGFAFSNHGSPQSSPPTSPPRRPMQFGPMSGAEYDQQNPFQTQAEYGMVQQGQQPGHMRGMSQASSNGKNPFE